MYMKPQVQGRTDNEAEINSKQGFSLDKHYHGNHSPVRIYIIQFFDELDLTIYTYNPSICKE